MKRGSSGHGEAGCLTIFVVLDGRLLRSRGRLYVEKQIQITHAMRSRFPVFTTPFSPRFHTERCHSDRARGTTNPVRSLPLTVAHQRMLPACFIASHSSLLPASQASHITNAYLSCEHATTIAFTKRRNVGTAYRKARGFGTSICEM